MAVHSALSSDDLVRIYRLLHTLCEIGRDTRAWRTHLMDELSAWLDSPIAVSYAMNFSLDPADAHPKPVIYLDRGTNEAWQAYMAVGDLTSDPMTAHIMQRFGTDFTVRREDWVDDATWYASDYYKNVRVPANLDAAIYSQIGVISPKVMDGFSLGRHVGDRPYTDRELAIVRTLHQELARLWNRVDPINEHTLPPRVRETLDGIRRGESRKKIAEQMSVSDHTVHSYERDLFTRAGVKSRGELLSLLAEIVRPALLP